MIEILRDPLWQFVGAIFALLALPAAFWIHLHQRERKEIAYGILSSRRLISLSSELRGRVEITLDGKTVKDVHLLVIGIKNSGNTPIIESDFVHPPSVRASKGTEFISAEITKHLPSNLQPTLTLYSDQLEVRPLLLNPGDYISIQALASGQYPWATPDFRIIGTSKIEQLLKARPFSDKSAWGALAFWFCFLVFMIFAGTYMDSTPKKILWIGGPCTVMLYVFYRWAKSRLGVEASRYADDA